jgi:hypothetical protein
MPTRHDNWFGGVAGFAPLHAAWHKAVLGKRHKPGSAAFTAKETNLLGTLRFCFAFG